MQSVGLEIYSTVGVADVTGCLCWIVAWSAHLALRYTDDISIPFWDQQPQLIHHVRHKSLHKSTAKERAMRDLYFENRRKYL